MNWTPIFALAGCFLASCSTFQTTLPAREKPTRYVGRNYSRENVRHYETYDLGRQRDYATDGYKVAFVHMKDGSAFPLPCMPTRDGMSPTISVSVRANAKNDAWRVSTYLRRKDNGNLHFVEAEFASMGSDLFLRRQTDFDGTIVEFSRLEGHASSSGRKLRRVPNLPLVD